jgi:starch-binding outer membrane protein, SusD/RagB family
MIRFVKYTLFTALFMAAACNDILDPQPIDLLVTELALNEATDVGPVVTGLYGALRTTGSPTIIAGDFTADMITHRGTFTQYRELGTKQITPANAAVTSLWSNLYNTIYIANFILERLPDITGVPAAQRREVTATARFLRGYAYFIGVNTYGDIPLVTTTDRNTNRNIARTSAEEIISFVEQDYLAALPDLPQEPASVAFASRGAVQAALARFYLYQRDWAKAEQYATAVISSGKYTLVNEFVQLVQQDFTTEAILELGYTANDDPGTSATGLNNLFVGRREVVPSNEILDS